MNYRDKIFNLLGDMFVGEKIEGQGGFINLMKFKQKYYDEVFKPKLEEKIKEVIEKYQNFENELYEKLYTFFSRYFSESGSIYFVNTPSYHQIYEKVYTDEEDVILFWKTRDLYYIKTDRIYRSMDVEIEEGEKKFKFHFDTSTLQFKKANEKREIIYELDEENTNSEKITFKVYSSENRRKTNTTEILKKLKNKNIKILEDTLEKAFKKFEQQAEVDYFIHKNAKAFLEEQLKLYIYNYFFKEEQTWTSERIDQINKFKECAELIIEFVSRFEDELVKIWNKPRFVLNSNYVITLDRIVKQNKEKGIEIIEKILNHPNFNEQIKEWQELGIIDENFDKEKIIQKDLTGVNLNKNYQFLPIDTKYFKDLELEILELFNDLDNSLDGWLIKSENYQALNTILEKFKERIQTIYIDPPFNKEQDADYLYNVKYKDSTWVTMLENRIRVARELLDEKGSIFVRCDYNGNMYVRMLLNDIFGEENFRNEIILKRTTGLPKRELLNMEVETEYLIYYVKNSDKLLFNQLWEERKPEWMLVMIKYNRGGPTGKPIIIEGKVYNPPEGYSWAIGGEIAERLYKEGRLKIENDKLYVLIDKKTVGTNWTDTPGYVSPPKWGFPTENHEKMLKRAIEMTSKEGDVILDFFLGSGTTTATAHKLKRKWIGIEMGEHFYTVVLPRMKKVLAYDKSGISKEEDVKEKYNKDNAGGFFKYFELEQFADILEKSIYTTEIKQRKLLDDFNYIFMPHPKMLESIELDYENNKVKLDLSKVYKNIDIAETLSNLKGKWIRKITKDEVELEDGEKVDLKNLDYKDIKQLIWW
jgi:adenine specific DNA methylase Mod